VSERETAGNFPTFVQVGALTEIDDTHILEIDCPVGWRPDQRADHERVHQRPAQEVEAGLVGHREDNAGSAQTLLSEVMQHGRQFGKLTIRNPFLSVIIFLNAQL
jgi:hypothetical protein